MNSDPKISCTFFTDFPVYFKEQGLPSSLEEIPLEYFERAFQWLENQKEIIPNDYTIIGGSKGAEIGLLLGSRYNPIKTVVGITPSSVIWQGIPSSRLNIGKNPKSSWSFDGIGLPYVPSSLSSKDWLALLTSRLCKIAEKDLKNAAQLNEAQIPVERIQGKILLISAKKDQLWPSTYMCEQMMKRLVDNGFSYPFRHEVYDKGHSGLMMDKNVWRTVFNFLTEKTE